MKIMIRSVRSIGQADIETSGITVITGGNMSGKTSICRAISATMLGTSKIFGATKKDASGVINSEAKAASCSVSSGIVAEDGFDTWTSRMVWPDAESMIQGDAPPVNEITMGTVNPVADFDAKQWATFIRDISGAETKLTPKLIQDAISRSAGGDKAQIKEIMCNIQYGIESAADSAKKRASVNRRDWESTTGVRFGKDKATGWTHEHYGGIDDVDEMKEKVSELEAELARSRAQDEVLGGQRSDIEQEIKEYEHRKLEIVPLFEKAKKFRNDTDEELKKYPKSDTLSCPCCDAKLVYDGSNLAKADDTKYRRDSEEYCLLVNKSKNGQDQINKLGQESGSITAKLEAAKVTLRKFDEAGDKARSVEVVKTELDNLKNIVTGNETTNKATKLFEDWNFWTKVSDLLGPTGLRLDATKKAVSNLQPKIDAIAAKVFPGHGIKIDATSDGLDVLIDGRDYETMVDKGDPNSYALALQGMFQIIAAQQLGDGAFILVDRIDTMKKDRLNGFLKAVRSSGVEAIMFKAVDARPDLDPLSKAGAGKTYWIENGIVEPVLSTTDREDENPRPE